MNGLYLQLHAYMLRIAVPVRHAVGQADAHARPTSRAPTTAATAISPRAQNIQFNWPKLRDIPDILQRSRRGRDACHPDLGQLHPQHHHRPVRRCRGRRDHRSAAGRRNPAPVVEPSPRILLPAAQVQDRHERRRRHDRAAIQLPRYRPAGRDERTRARSAGRSGSAAAWAARR